MINAQSSAIAGGVIVSALIDMLVSKGVLSREEVATVLNNANGRLGSYGQSPDIAAARAGITDLAQRYTQSRS